MRIGNGYDVHQLVEGRKLILGGIEIPHRLGLLGHSDADVLVHAIMDAILGALALGDIGKHFPDTDPQYAGISSITLLKHVMSLMSRYQYRIGNVDAVVMCERPKLAPYIQLMREKIATSLACDISAISIKATTTEKLGFVGREEGIAVQAVVLLKPLYVEKI